MSSEISKFSGRSGTGRQIARGWTKTEWRKRAGLFVVSCGIAALVALGILSMPQAARAQGSRKDDIVFDAQGHPMAGATVRVCTASATGEPCTPLANIYSDSGLTQAMANPLQTDGLGNYTFYAAPGRYEIEISGPNITTKQMPNVILPNDPSTPTFTTLTTTSGISAFSLTLSGNLTVNGSTAVTGTLTEGGAPVATTTPSFVTVNAESSLPNSRQLVNGTGTTINTSVPGQISINASGTAAAFPYSVAAFGARSINVNTGVAWAATCTASSTSVTLANAGQFQNGDGIFLPGCGAATSLTTPSAPTITPVALAGPENSGLAVALSGQSTAYAYCISAEDLGNGHTACSANGATSSGDATLGEHQATINTCSLSGIVVTCTLTTSPTDLPAGAYVHILGANPSQFDAWTNLNTVSGNTITFVQPENSNYAGVATSGSGGTMTWKVANLIGLPSGTSAQDFIIYGRTSGSLGYECISEHDASGGFQQLWFMDYGSPESSNCPEPAWIPSTPPAAALADGLVTTVASGAGTTSITLATAATSSSGTNGAIAQYDNCAQIQAAANAAINSAGALYFPAGEWVIGSYCQLPAGLTINQGGLIELYNTLQANNWRWYAGSYASGNQPAAFSVVPPGATPVSIQSSPYPGIYVPAGNGFYAESLYMNSSATNSATLLLVDDNTGFIIDKSYIATGNGNGEDYLGSSLIVRSYSTGSFDNSITNSTLSGGVAQYPSDSTWAPTILVQNDGGYVFKKFDNINTGTRGGIGFYNANNGLFIALSNWHLQGPVTPLLQTNESYGYAYFTNILLDSSASTAIFAYSPGYGNYTSGNDWFGGTVSLTNSGNPANDTYGSVGVISGFPVENVIAGGTEYDIGQNFSDTQLNNSATTAVSFGAVNPTISTVMQPTGPTVVPYGQPAPFAFTPAYPTPSVSVSSGGSVPTGTLCYRVAPIYPSGGLGALSACANATVTSGSQTVTASIASAIPGAAGYAWFRSNNSGGGAVHDCWNVGTSCTDSYGFTDVNNIPSAPADGFPHFGSDGMRTPQVTTGALTGALVTKSAAYTLTASDYWVNVTGTTTITVPHAIVGQHWVVFNSGSNTVTIAADSGNINGAASITLSANTGKEITCDGSNCFAH